MTKGFKGDAMGRVCGIETVAVEWTSTTPDDQGKKPQWKLKQIPGTEKILPADIVVLALGFLGPEPRLARDQGLNLDKRSNFEAEYGEFKTSVDRVYAAGDCRRGQSLVVWAINEGRLAADRINESLANAPPRELTSQL